jgi:hypothetical protein
VKGNFYRDWQVTDEQRKLAERLREQERARMEPVLREHDAAVAAASPLAAAVLDLHKPVGPWPHCTGCDMEGYEVEWPEFPCSTYTLVKEWRDTPRPYMGPIPKHDPTWANEAHAQGAVGAPGAVPTYAERMGLTDAQMLHPTDGQEVK